MGSCISKCGREIVVGTATGYGLDGPVIESRLALLGAHHILHVSTIRVKPHLLALLGAHHILHVSMIRVKSHLPSAGIIRSSPYSPR